MLTLAASVLLASLAAPMAPSAPATQPTPESPEQRDARMAWWREARFGMFIHWGVYAVPAGEWDGQTVRGISEWIQKRARVPAERYEPLAEQFNPVKFDADAWVKLAKDAGCRYIVITAKHHDGFCMFDADNTAYDIVDATPYGKDPLKALAAACEEHGIKLGFYYSIMDWHHPAAQRAGFPDYGKVDNDRFAAEYVPYMKRHLEQLLGGGYGDVAVLWFDGEWVREWTPALGREMEAYVRSLDGDIVINNRVGKHRSTDFGDFGTPEQKIPKGAPDFDWETCMTINGSWGYKVSDEDWKSPQTLVRNLIDIASKGGNYLLNVGPTAEGVIPQPSAERLRAMGGWLETHGEAIYGTRAANLKQPAWGRVTARRGADTLYLHVFDWPDDGVLVLEGAPMFVLSASLLGKPDAEVEVVTRQGDVTLKLPAKPGGDLPAVIRLQMKRTW